MIRTGFKQRNLESSEGEVFTFCGNLYTMDALSEPVRGLVKREIANHPKRAFLSNAYRALRGSDEILRSRGFADQALYCVASRRELDLTSHL